MSIVSFFKKDYEKIKRDKIEKEEILEAIRHAAIEVQCTSEYINYVKDTKLLEYAIYSENAAKCKYEYLLKLAKDKGIKNYA